MDHRSIPVNYQPFGEPFASQLPSRRFGPFGRWLPDAWARPDFVGDGGYGPCAAPDFHHGRKRGHCKKGRRNRSESTSSSSSSDSSLDSSPEEEVGRRSPGPAKKCGGRRHGQRFHGHGHGHGHGYGHGHKHHFMRPFMPGGFYGHHGFKHHGGPRFGHCERGPAVDLAIQNGDNEDFHVVEPDEALASDVRRLNISEPSTEKRYKLKLHELRRYDPSEVEVLLRNGKLTVKATRTKEIESRSITRSETHVITLPEDVDPDSLQIKFKPRKGLLILGTKSVAATAAAE